MDPRPVVSTHPSGSKALSKRPVIRLRPREGRRVKSGAPWVFSNEIAMDAPVKALPPGTAIELAAEDGSPIGAGYFNPRSLIAVRLLAPPGTVFDTPFFAGRLRRALAIRETFFTEPYYRLVHAEGDRLPGVVVDRFGEAVVVQITTAGMDASDGAHFWRRSTTSSRRLV